jgi:hypothetical protein
MTASGMAVPMAAFAPVEGLLWEDGDDVGEEEVVAVVGGCEACCEMAWLKGMTKLISFFVRLIGSTDVRGMEAVATCRGYDSYESPPLQSSNQFGVSSLS